MGKSQRAFLLSKRTSRSIKITRPSKTNPPFQKYFRNRANYHIENLSIPFVHRSQRSRTLLAPLGGVTGKSKGLYGIFISKPLYALSVKFNGITR